jgi:dihydroorotate dehydrogenase
VANSINQELLALLKKDGFKNISQAVGAAHKNKNRGSKAADGA